MCTRRCCEWIYYGGGCRGNAPELLIQIVYTLERYYALLCSIAAYQQMRCHLDCHNSYHRRQSAVNNKRFAPLFCNIMRCWYSTEVEVCHKISQTKNSENGNGPVKGISRISAWRLSALHDTRTPRTQAQTLPGIQGYYGTKNWI